MNAQTFSGIAYQMARILDAILMVQAAEIGCLVATTCQRCGQDSYGNTCPGCCDESRLN